MRPSHHGRGHARPLLEAVLALARQQPGSTGIALNTEDPRNIPLYERFGFRVHFERHAGGVRTWGMFRGT